MGPISTAAGLQLAASIPNFTILEYPIGEHDSPKRDWVVRPAEREGGFLLIPEGPGIGVELVDGIEERFPYRPQPVVTRLHVDGSVSDASSR
jgi:galactonate dehydratase